MIKISCWAVRGRSNEAEYAYVTCDNGIQWDCMDQGGGGHLICESMMSPKQVAQLCMKDQCAGIKHALTGTSHQAANRILWPTRTLVSEVKGYWACALLFGAYGSDTTEWLRTTGRCVVVHEQPGVAATPADRWRAPDVRDLAAAIQDLYIKASRRPGRMEPDAIIEQEMELVIENRLGRCYSKHKFSLLMRRHNALIKKKRSLVSELTSSSMDMDAYTSEINTALNEALLDMACDIGIRDFISLFEFDPSTPVKIAPSWQKPAGLRKGQQARYNKSKWSQDPQDIARQPLGSR